VSAAYARLPPEQGGRATAERRKSVYRAAFQHRDVRWLMAAAAASRSGDFLYGVALIAVVFSRTGSVGWVAVTVVLARLPLVVLAPVAGMVADRFERRDLMIVLDVSRAVAMAGIAAVVAVDGPIAAVVALAVVVAALGTAYYPATVGLLPALVPEEDIAAANSVAGGLESLALVAGPAAGAVLLVVGSPALAFSVNAATFVVSALFLLAVRRGQQPRALPALAGGSRILTGWRALTSDSTVLVVAAGLVSVSFAVGASSVFFVDLSAEALGTGAHGYGYLAAAVGVGGFLASLTGDRLAAGGRIADTVTIALAASGSAVIAMATVSNAAFAWALAVVFGAGYVLLEVLAVTLMQRCLDAGVLGQASGTLDGATFGAVLLGAAVMAPVIAYAGLTVGLIVAGAPALVAALLTGAFARRLDERSGSGLDELAPRLGVLADVAALVGASRPALERLATAAHDQHVRAGTVVVRQGEPASDFYVVVDGRYDVSSANGRTDHPAHIAQLEPGDYFGEIGLLEGWARTATVRATTDGTLLCIPGADFLQVVTAMPHVAGTLREVATTRLGRLHNPRD
jgi:CRP-like cAMP-binding protein